MRKMKIALNGLIIDSRRAGIGHYGYNLINSLVGLSQEEYTVYLQKSVELDYNNVVYKGEYNKSYKRIFLEQLVLPFQYNNASIVHFIDYSSPLLNIRRPFIITIHDLAFYKYPSSFTLGSRKIKQVLTPIGIKRAAAIIAVSENTKKDIVELFPKAAEKVKVVYPGRPNYGKVTNMSELERVKRKYNIYGQYILSVGTLEPRKNIIRLLKAFEMVSKVDKNLKLVLTGSKGWMYGDIFKQISSLEAKSRIILTGYVNDDELPCLYSGAKLFVYPSLYEGFGLPPLEAMCCGTPVVVSDSSSLSEVVGDAGVYVDPTEIESISNGIIQVMNDSKLREKLIKKGYEQSKKFSWDNAASQVVDIYHQILG